MDVFSPWINIETREQVCVSGKNGDSLDWRAHSGNNHLISGL